MEIVSSQERFRILSPAAEEIFSYVSDDPELTKAQWVFRAAIVERDEAQAKFTKIGDLLAAEVLWISAKSDKAGVWFLSHSHVRT